MDYNLSRLSPRSFEQLIQALASAVIGPGIVVFGDGPDGGREAIYDGPMLFPNDAAPWNGYLVVQAKFRQRPGRDDGDWARRELRKELKKFTDPRRKLRKPEYYLFATNVVLTPAVDTGGKDRVTRLLEEYTPQLGLKGFHVWDYDQIGTLVDLYPAIRQTYLDRITPGDVLTKVLERMEPKRPDFRRVMSLLLQKELLADQYVKLGQAGHSDEGRTPLARVFVELPVGDAKEFADAAAADPLAATGSGKKEETPNAIRELLSLGSAWLDPQSNLQPNRPAPGEQVTQEPGRVVLVGGPGQGKSTLGQFLCQLHRVKLLDTHIDPQAHLLPEVQAARALIREQCEAESLSLPAVARFPLRVELNAFASELENEQASSLFDYLLRRIRMRTDYEIEQDDLRAWLAAYPWLMVLDGLDEVPAASNRGQVLEAIQGFLVEAHTCNADLLLVATTRPQGYNDDFSPDYYRHRYLLPLDVSRALRYAGRLAAERWPDDMDRRQRIAERLERAGEEAATARLMKSPLQVTIMALLVETVGQPPRERWRLFNKYYEVIFQREQERDIPAAELLNRFESDIHAIHQRVGRYLQMQSERSGGTEAVLSLDQFRKLVEERLTEEGHEGEELARLAGNIINAALERLVFLVAPREKVIGFEIRSLQEFMAAQWLMEDKDDTVRRNLRAIAPASHWRNVFLFATGRCFHDKQHLRAEVKVLCDECNEGGGIQQPDTGLEQGLLLGSRLALEILEDGALGNQPGQLKVYARLALRLLELPPAEEHRRLARQYRPALEAVFREELQRHLGNQWLERQFGAWRTLLELIRREETPWAPGMADAHWPQTPEAGLGILKVFEGIGQPSGWLVGRLAELIPKVTPGEIGGLPFGIRRSWANLPESQDREIIRAAGELSATRSGLGVTINDIERIAFTLVPLHAGESSERRDLRPFPGRWEWQWLFAVEEFRQRPSQEGLAALLAGLAKHRVEDITRQFGRTLSNLAWPVEACIRAAQEGEDLDRLARAAERGLLGDKADWLVAQGRWKESGLTERDLCYEPKDGLPFDDRIGDCGFPFEVGYDFSPPLTINTISQLHTIWKVLPPSLARNRVADVILFLLRLSDSVWQAISGAELLGLARDAKLKELALRLLQLLPERVWEDEDGRQAIELLGRYEQIFPEPIAPETARHLERLLREYPQPWGILRLLAAACASGYRPETKVPIFAPTGCEEARYRGAALLIRIAQGILASGEIEPAEVARELAGLSEAVPGERLLNRALRVIDEQRLSGPGVERFLVALLQALPERDWRGRRRVLGTMQDQQRRHVSCLSEKV